MIYIKHNRFMDVAILLKGTIRKYGSTFVIKGKYVNQGYVETFELGVPATIRIHESKIHDWQICRNPTEDCIRNSKWVPFVVRKHVNQ